MENSFEWEKNSGKFCTKTLLVPTGQEFWPECNVAIFAWKLIGGKFGGLRNRLKILYIYIYKINKNSGNICMKMPFCPTGKEFWLDYNLSVFAPKLAGNIFSGPTTKLKILLKEKKKGKFCTKMPFCLTSQEFWPEYNVGIFTAELVDRIFSAPRK